MDIKFKREEFFKKCKDDHDRLVKLIMDAGEVSVSSDIVGVVKTQTKTGTRTYPVYLYKIGDKEYRVSKKLHEFLVEHGALEREGEGHEA